MKFRPLYIVSFFLVSSAVALSCFHFVSLAKGRAVDVLADTTWSDYTNTFFFLKRGGVVLSLEDNTGGPRYEGTYRLTGKNVEMKFPKGMVATAIIDGEEMNVTVTFNDGKRIEYSLDKITY